MNTAQIFLLELAREVLRKPKGNSEAVMHRAQTAVRDLSPDNAEVLRAETFLAEASA